MADHGPGTIACESDGTFLSYQIDDDYKVRLLQAQ
jgi:hypothetical protein